MNLNIHSWRYFKISNLFEDFTGGDLIISEIKQGTIPIASNSAKNNNIAAYSDVIPNRKLFDHRISISIADRGRFWAFIQPKDFYIGTRAKALVSKNTHITVNQLVFITTIINRESFKFCYGRNCCDNLPNILIKLPIQHNKDGSVLIDNSHDFSDDGYIPDWQYMENYIKSLHYKPLTTKNNIIDVPNLNISDWKSFKLSDYFNPIRGIRLVESDREKGNIPLVTAGEFNNGVKQKISNAAITRKNCITIDMFGNSFYQNNIFSFDDNIIALEDKLPLSKYTKLFLVSILRIDKYRYQYGRQYRLKNFTNQMIKLPATLNAHTNEYEPDWEYMENYIKSLPYGDRI